MSVEFMEKVRRGYGYHMMRYARSLGIRSMEWGERNGVGVAVFYGAVCLRVAIGKEKFLGLFLRIV